METQKLAVEITFTEPLLATSPGNREIHAEFIASKSPNPESGEEETETIPLEEQIEKASTVFHRDDKGLFLFDYMVRGFLKEQIGALCELGQFDKLSKWTFKRAMDGCVFVNPRRIYLIAPDGSNLMRPDGTLQRPLRAETMQGDRVALARSEFANAGTRIRYEINLLVSENPKSAWKEITMAKLRDALNMGALKGQGQWRSGGHGQFTWTEA